jgi:hypothetical protein
MSLNREMIIFLIPTSYLTIYQLAHLLLKNNNNNKYCKWGHFVGTYKVRNEIETKRKETKSTKTKRNETTSLLASTNRKNNYHHNLKFERTTFKSQKNKDTSTNIKEINPQLK